MNDIILVQGAMDEEIDLLLSSINDKTEQTFGGWTYWIGNISGVKVVLSRTEIGYANAAAATAIGIQQYSPKFIINQGTSGGHHPDLYRGDIVICEKAVSIGAHESPLTPIGGGINPHKWQPFSDVCIIRDGGKAIPHNDGFKADQRLADKAFALADKYAHGKVVKGVIGSGDEWNRELDRINWLHTTMGTYVEEMETFAVGLVATAFKTPFVGIRVVSNTDVQSQELDRNTATYCQEFVLEYLRSMISLY